MRGICLGHGLRISYQLVFWPRFRFLHVLTLLENTQRTKVCIRFAIFMPEGASFNRARPPLQDLSCEQAPV